MKETRNVQESLLEELRLLDDERVRYQLEHPSAQLGMEDPDVRRLIEALAYSSVRTRQTTMRNLFVTWKRLLSAYFHFILQPLPSMTMLQAVVTPQMTDTVTLPRGSSMQFRTLDGAVGSFQTLSELRVVPITLARVELQLTKQGFRLVLMFLSLHQRGDNLGTIPIHINYLDHYPASLKLHHLLRKHLKECFVFYDGNFGPNTSGVRCEVTFGMYFDRPYEDNAQNPLEQVRTFFHFPSQDLMVYITIPPATQTWNRVYVCMDLDHDFPRDQPLHRDVFRPHTVAVANRYRAFSRTIDCDGTKDEYPVRFLNNDSTFAMERPLGVYRTTAKGLEPLGHAALGTFRQAYEIEEQTSDTRFPSYSLIIRRPEAFMDPQQLVVEAHWYQPLFVNGAVGPVQVIPLERVAAGLDFRQIGLLSQSLDSPLRQDPDRLLYLLSLKMKPVLQKEELLDLLEMFGSLERSPFARMTKLLSKITHSIVPDGTLSGAGIRHVYHIEVAPHDDQDTPMLTQYLLQLVNILDAWDYEARVDIRTTPDLIPLKHAEIPRAQRRTV